ncbi:hypothetical protein E2C01_033934 [Portunus trituberculatus]|uniref:Uncharacterized protein n=1 Tax=Portunus trituberculatus TaxID=210409 RepID=A0A5B7F5F1_PORTR|nr:hypothetical protein [Portunus trituberculatus]
MYRSSKVSSSSFMRWESSARLMVLVLRTSLCASCPPPPSPRPAEPSLSRSRTACQEPCSSGSVPPGAPHTDGLRPSRRCPAAASDSLLPSVPSHKNPFQSSQPKYTYLSGKSHLALCQVGHHFLQCLSLRLRLLCSYLRRLTPLGHRLHTPQLSHTFCQQHVNYQLFNTGHFNKH